MAKTIRDAVHGDIRFASEELRLVDTPAVQRLRGIKQLGTSSLVYPSAVHSRFEHSLGTASLARRILESVVHNDGALSERQQRLTIAAALLHDVTHVPFGHTFEDERRLFPRHDEDAERLAHFLSQPDISQCLADAGLRESLEDLLLGRSTADPLVKQIVSGTVCADLLDYLRRDAFHTGLTLNYDDRLFDSFAIADGKLVIRLHKSGSFRRDALSELVHLLQIRYSLTERVYFHHAKIIAGAMISRALELALAAGTITQRDLYNLKDDVFLDRLARIGEEVAGVADLMKDLSRRSLYKRAYFLTIEGLGRPGVGAAERDALAVRFHHNLAERSRAEAQIAGALGLPESHVILYCPSPKMSLKEADVPVEVAPGRIEPLSTLDHPDVAALSSKHRGLWRLYVLLRRSHGHLADDAGRLAEDIVGYPNQLRDPILTPSTSIP